MCGPTRYDQSAAMFGNRHRIGELAMTRKTIASFTVAAALLTPQAASAADLYVGPNDGDTDCTIDSPCTLWSAAGVAHTLGVKPQ